MNNPQQPNDSELLLSVTEKLDEYNFLPGLTHEEDCGYWGTEDGEGEDYCDCEYKKEVGLWKDCRAELAALIQDEILKARTEEAKFFRDTLSDREIRELSHQPTLATWQMHIDGLEAQLNQLKTKEER